MEVALYFSPARLSPDAAFSHEQEGERECSEKQQSGSAPANSFPLSKRLNFLWHLHIANLTVVQANHPHPQAVFYFAFAEISSGRQRSSCSRSSATCLDSRMCPASPQSITRCAMLMPAPAMVARSLTSAISLTGPL